ncbi:MAG: alpha/beta fold hydrolase [Solirubrobacteraceae bacterium]
MPVLRLSRRRVAASAAVAALGAGAALVRRHAQMVRSDPESARLRTTPKGRPQTVLSPDGTRLHVEVFGAESAPTVVLSHGWTEQISYWVYVIDELTGRHGLRVVAFDHRGHGQSEPAADGDYSMARFGEDIEAVLQACVAPDGRAVVAGHSLGAMALVAWAEHHDPQARASAAALINTGVSNLVNDSLIIPIPVLAQALNRLIPPSRFVGSRAPLPRFSTPLSYALTRWVAFGPTATPAQVAFYERMLISCRPEARASIGIAISQLDLAHALANLTVPTLVIAGDQDRLTPPSHAERIAAALPRLARLAILEQTGHMSPLERPAEVSEAISQLAASVGAAAGELPLQTPTPS